MANLDLSFLLSDPDFVSTAQLYRTTQVAGSNGRPVDTAAGPVDIVAAIVPASGLSLSRLPEGDRAVGTIDVHTQTRLTARTRTEAPDEIVFQSRRYIVVSVSDWSIFGAGFYTATCNLRDVTPGT